MSNGEIRQHVNKRAGTRSGTIARRTIEHLPGHAHKIGAVVEDVQPIALAFIRASHGRGCGCTYCS